MLRSTLLSAVAVLALASPAPAQSTLPMGSGMMWGTSVGGVSVPGALDSALMHNQQGQVAAQAKARGNLTTNNISNYSIGVFNSNAISGNNNSLGSTQNGTNSGPVTNNGTIQ